MSYLKKTRQREIASAITGSYWARRRNKSPTIEQIRAVEAIALKLVRNYSTDSEDALLTGVIDGKVSANLSVDFDLEISDQLPA